jgi:hypothetical protein
MGRRVKTLPSDVNKLRDYIDTLDQGLPQTARTIILSTYATYYRRVLVGKTIQGGRSKTALARPALPCFNSNLPGARLYNATRWT